MDGEAAISHAARWRLPKRVRLRTSQSRRTSHHHFTRPLPGVASKETAMASATPLHITAAALLLGVAACNFEKLDVVDSPLTPAAAAAMEVPPLGLELHRMFEEEKRGASVAELPPQF
jgi:hypothetical protein